MYGMGMGGLGMGGMYGGMGGMGGMGSMYGGGYGNGMYGGGYGSGMYGNSMGGSYGGMNNGMNNGYSGSMMGNNGMTSGVNTFDQNGVNNQGQMGVNIGDSTGAPQSPIQQSEPLPPLNETPVERGRRVRAERKKEQQLIRQQREQRKQMRMQAKMEIAGHLTNVLVQTLRSVMELFAVCFGTYYSIKAVKAFASAPDAMRGNPNAATAAAKQSTGALTTQKGAESKGRWKTWLLFGVLFIIGEVVYSILTKKKSDKASSRRGIRDYGHHYESDYDRSFDSDDSLEWREEYLLEEEAKEEGERRMYIAMCDYEGGEGDDFISFKAGDKFLVSDYDQSSWCDAVKVNDAQGNTTSRIRGLIPGNYIRMFEFNNTKM